MTWRSIGVDIVVTFLVMALAAFAEGSFLLTFRLVNSLPVQLIVFGVGGGVSGGLSQLALRKLRSRKA